MEMINQRARKLKQGAIRAMFDRAAKMQNVISMGIGEPDMPTPELVRNAVKEALDLGLTHYTPNAGFPFLRKAVAEKSSVAPVCYDPEKEIIITNGGMGGLSLLFLVLLEDGDEILIQDPQWLNYVAQVEYCGGKAVRVPTSAENNFEMQPETIEKLITPKTKALMINSPNNPTGGVMSDETMEKIADLAIRHDLIIISDEVYDTLVYHDKPCHSIAELPHMKERTAVINSFSKSYAMTGIRIGYVAANEEVVDRMTKCQENFNSCANSIGQYAASKALDHPELSLEIREVFAERRKIVLEALKKIPGIRFCDPEGAFYVFPDISSFGISSADFCNELLTKEGVVCVPGSAFGECGEGYIRMCYTCSTENLIEALTRFTRFCSTLSKAG